MPFYEYECQDCGYLFERKQSFHDSPIDKCPNCEGNVFRLISAPQVIYRGAGFFATDNKKDTQVMSASGQLAQRVSETDKSNISTTPIDSKGRPLAVKPRKQT